MTAIKAAGSGWLAAVRAYLGTPRGASTPPVIAGRLATFPCESFSDGLRTTSDDDLVHDVRVHLEMLDAGRAARPGLYPVRRPERTVVHVWTLHGSFRLSSGW